MPCPIIHCLYFVTRKGIPTVVGYKDPKLGPTGLTPGWHLTPAGRNYSIFSRVAWRGRVLMFGESKDAEYWAVKSDEGDTVFLLLNFGESQITRRFSPGQIKIAAPPHSLVSVDSSGHEVGRILFRP